MCSFPWDCGMFHYFDTVRWSNNPRLKTQQNKLSVPLYLLSWGCLSVDSSLTPRSCLLKASWSATRQLGLLRLIDIIVSFSWSDILVELLGLAVNALITINNKTFFFRYNISITIHFLFLFLFFFFFFHSLLLTTIRKGLP